MTPPGRSRGQPYTVRRLAAPGRCTNCGRVQKRLFTYQSHAGSYSGTFCSADCCEDYHSMRLPRPINIPGRS